MHSRVSYETLAIKASYLYRKFGMTTMKHRKATVASIFQNGTSQNEKCDGFVGFCKSSHKYIPHIPKH